jgi:hypothetical protein
MSDVAAPTAGLTAASSVDGAAFGRRLIPPGDPLAGATFDAIWENQIRPELAGLESDRRQAVMAFVLALLAGALLVFIEIALIPGLLKSRGGSQLPIFTLIAAAALGFWPIRKVAHTAKADVVTALCQPMSVVYQPACPQAPSFDEFLSLALLPRPSGKTFQDFFSGRRGAVDFSLCQAVLTQGSGRSRTTVFRGQLFRLTRPKAFLGTTVVLRNTGFTRVFSKPAGLADVGLEDPEFRKVFQAYGSDQVEAREILTPTFMQELMDLEVQYGGEKLRCAFVGPDLLVALEGGDRFEIGGMFTSLVDRARVEKIARDLEQVFKLIDAFQLS